MFYYYCLFLFSLLPTLSFLSNEATPCCFTVAVPALPIVIKTDHRDLTTKRVTGNKCTVLSLINTVS